MLRTQVHGFQVECPHCEGDGQHHGQVPWPNCLRCAGYGSIVVTDPTGFKRFDRKED